jgi:hypothetical protein
MRAVVRINLTLWGGIGGFADIAPHLPWECAQIFSA